MDKEEAIKQTKISIETLKGGARNFREQVNHHLIQEIADESLLVDFALMLRDNYNDGIRETRKRLEALIEMIENPAQQLVKLPKELSYPRLIIDDRHVNLCTCLIPSLLHNKKIKNENLAKFLNWFCELKAGNQIRALPPGLWESHFLKWLLAPFEKRTDGKYDSNIWNEEYFEMVDERLAMIAERRITTILGLTDHCSFKTSPKNGYWARLFWNGDNNINGTSNEWAAMYHWYESQHQGKLDWVTTGKYLVRYYKRMFELGMKYWPFVKFEFGNEVRASVSWNKTLLDIAAPYRPEGWDKFPKFSLQTSVNEQDIGWLKYKGIENVCEVSIHGMYNKAGYEKRIAEVGKPGVKYIISQDGCPPTKTPEETKELILESLSDGQRGVELNLRPLHEYHGEWENMGKNCDWTFKRMMETSEPWFKASGEALQQYLNEAQKS